MGMDSTTSWASMGSSLALAYSNLTNQLESYGNIIPKDLITSFRGYTKTIYKADLQDDYSQPVPWIGLYIALASLACILTMVLDLLHAFRTRRLWFPCKYFTLNAASLSMIAVAIKLPMDISNSMPTTTDQVTKIGSMAFLGTMMVNLLPSLASMDNHQLVTNIFALSVMVTTLVVNVCIQMYTGVVSSRDYRQTVDLLSKHKPPSSYGYIDQTKVIASIYVSMLVFLLTVHICSALALLESKRLLESKYQKVKADLKKEEDLKTFDVKKLKKHVSNHWIMAETGSPQLMAVCSVTTYASGFICVLGAILYLLVMLFAYLDIEDHDSDYQWSIPMIFIIQSSGVILGTVAPVARCLASLNFKLSKNWIRDHIKVFKVESYWIQMLSDLKHGSIPFPFHTSHKFTLIIQKSQILILDIWIVFQILVVVSCKTLALISIFYVVCGKMLKDMFICLEENAPQIINKDDDDYVVQLQDYMKPDEKTLKRIKKSFDNKIKKAENQHPGNLMILVKKSTGFDVEPLLPEGYPKCWSLPLVTLSAIAASLQINKHDYDLFTAVSKGVEYVRLVEKSIINAKDEYRNIRKAAKKLWVEVEAEGKWLDKKVKERLPKKKKVKEQADHKTAREILECFSKTSKKIIVNPESERTSPCICIDVGTATSSRNENIKFCRKVCAESMDRVTQFIMTYYQEKNISIDRVSQEMLFDLLSSLMADILAACLTNLPQAIAMKCYTKMIEKREESVHAAAQFLGETTQIIQYLQQGEIGFR